MSPLLDHVAMDPQPSIPVIDFAPLLKEDCHDESFTKAGKEIYEAFKNYGFAYIKNHSVPQEVVDEAFRWVCHRVTIAPIRYY